MMKQYFRPLAIGLCGAAALGCILTATQGGGSPLAFLQAAFAVFFGIWLPGAFFYRLLQLEKELAMFAFPAILTLGSGFFALCASVGFRLGAAWPALLVPFLFAAAELVCRFRQKQQFRFCVPTAELLLFAGLLCCAALCWAAANGHPAALGENALKQDFLWTVGNTRSFFLGFPPQDIRYVGVRLTYHYLNELLTAGISAVSGVAAYDLLAFVMPPVWIAVGLGCLHRLAVLLYGSESRAVWTALLIYGTGGCGAIALCLGSSRSFSAGMLYHLLTNINACGIALVYFSCFSGLVTVLMRQNFQGSIWLWATALGSFVMMLFAKGPIAVILALAFAAAAAVRLVQRRAGWRDLLFAVLLLGLFLAVYRFLFSAGANNMEMGLANTLMKMDTAPLLLAAEKKGAAIYYLLLPVLYLLCVFSMNPLLSAGYAVVAVRDVCRLKQLSGERLFLHAGAVGGTMAFFLFDHYALSQIYFLFLAFWCMACLIPMPEKWPKKKGARVLVGALAAISVSGLLCDAVRISQNGLAHLNGVRTAAADPEDQMAMTAGDEAAMAWLAEQMPPQEVFATNRYHTGSPLAGNSNLYTALSGRQAYMEGFRYTISNMGVSQQSVEERFINNAVLFSPKSSVQTIRTLAQAQNVRWLVFSCQMGEEPLAFAELEQVFANDEVHIYRVW